VRFRLSLAIPIFFSFSFFPQTSFLDSLLKNDLPAWSKVLNNPNKYKLQIIYTQINRDKKNKPKFTEYHFSLNKSYFYPASTVKLPIGLLALIKLEELKIPGLDRSSTMLTDSMFYCQKKIKDDSISAGTYPTIENYIKRMFLVSDNFSFARVYEFVGHDYAHKKLEELGYKDIRLFNRLDGQCPGDTAKITPPVYFLNPQKDTIYKQTLTFNELKLAHPIKSSKSGSIYINGEGKRVYQPKDFSTHNYMHISDLHSIMRRIIFNDHLSQKEKLPVSDDNREFMIRQLGLYPKESDYPVYDKKVFYDSFKKYFIYGSAIATIKQDSLRVINIVGRAYGFLIDCAYIIDFKNNIEYLLTASIYVNERNVIGGGRYEYDQIGLPFLKDLSLVLYNYERKRKREHQPNLEEFRKLFIR
jgi:hypothetical protein